MQFSTKQKTTKRNTRGFSLVELLVSLTLFSVVITMAIGTLLVLIDANTKAQNMQETMTNLTFALDSMTREIRTGRGYYCSNSLPSSINDATTRDCSQNTAFSIVEGGSSLTAGSGGNRVSYRLSGGSIERKVGNGGWVPITANTITIDTLLFTVEGSDGYQSEGDLTQPTVTIFIAGTAGDIEGLNTDFSMQTTITRRLRDI